MDLKVMKAAFDDELQKIAGAVRSGRRPLKVETLLSKEEGAAKVDKKKVADLTKMSAEEKKDDGKKANTAKNLALLGIGAYGVHRALTKKAADQKANVNTVKNLALLGAGMYGMHRAVKVKRRYDMGRQMEMQQQQGW